MNFPLSLRPVNMSGHFVLFKLLYPIIFFHSTYSSIPLTLVSHIIPLFLSYLSPVFFLSYFLSSIVCSVFNFFPPFIPIIPWVYPPFTLYHFLHSFISALFVHLFLHLLLAFLHPLTIPLSILSATFCPSHPSFLPSSFSYPDPFLADIIMSS